MQTAFFIKDTLLGEGTIKTYLMCINNSALYNPRLKMPIAPSKRHLSFQSNPTFAFPVSSLFISQVEIVPYTHTYTAIIYIGGKKVGGGSLVKVMGDRL